MSEDRKTEEGKYWYTDTEFPGIKVRMDGIREFVIDANLGLSDAQIERLMNGVGYWFLKRSSIMFPPPAASPVSDAGWISVTDDKKPDTGLRVEIFSPMYPVGDPMRHRIIDEQFLSISKDATHWRYLSEPFAISTPTNVQEQDELWEEAWDKGATLIGTDISDLDMYAGKLVMTVHDFERLKSKYTITKKQ